MTGEAIAVRLPGADIEAELAAARRPFLVALGKWLRNQPLGAVSALGIIFMIFMAIFAPQLAPFDPVVPLR